MCWLCKWYSSIFTCSVNTFFFDQEIEFSTFETTFLGKNQWMNFEPNVGANVHRRALWSSGRKCPENRKLVVLTGTGRPTFVCQVPPGGLEHTKSPSVGLGAAVETLMAVTRNWVEKLFKSPRWDLFRNFRFSLAERRGLVPHVPHHMSTHHWHK